MNIHNNHMTQFKNDHPKSCLHENIYNNKSPIFAQSEEMVLTSHYINLILFFDLLHSPEQFANFIGSELRSHI